MLAKFLLKYKVLLVHSQMHTLIFKFSVLLLILKTKIEEALIVFLKQYCPLSIDLVDQTELHPSWFLFVFCFITIQQYKSIADCVSITMIKNDDLLVLCKK